jgi:hypothetical protein
VAEPVRVAAAVRADPAGLTLDSTSGLPELAQKYQDGDGELQPSPVPEDIARESEVPSEADREQGQSDDGSDAPGGQNVAAAASLVQRALRLEDGVIHGASWHAGRARRRTTFGHLQTA